MQDCGVMEAVDVVFGLCLCLCLCCNVSIYGRQHSQIIAMSGFDTNVGKICLLYLGVFIALKILRVLAMVVVMILWFCLPMKKNTHQTVGMQSIAVIFGDLCLSVCNCLTAFVVQVASSVLYSLYVIYPFLILSLVLSVFHDQYDVAVHMVVRSYNSFVSNNAILVFVRHSLWFAKLFWEMTVPLYNYIVHISSGINMELFKALFYDTNTINVLWSVFTGVGVAFVELATAVTVWVQKDIFDCRYDRIATDMNELTTHQCMEYGPGKYRALVLGPVVLALQTAVAQGVLLVASLCPAVTSAVTALVYPVYDARMADIFENLANLFLGCVWTVWDVTHTRCRFAMASGLPSTLCVPDVAPLFHFAHQITMDTGDLLDNWANIANVIVMKFFMERAPGFCTVGEYDIHGIASETVFGGAETRLVALTDKLLAMSDGTSVIFANANDRTENQLRENAFLPAVNIHYGLAGIEYGDSVQHADVAGGTTTSVMGCSCMDTTRGSIDTVVIECHVALYDRVYNPDNVESYRKVIPVSFEGRQTGDLMQCKTLRITVQAVRFPHKQYDFMPTGFYGDRPSQKSPLLNCLVDPSKCNDVDAIIYVAPLCQMPGVPDGGTLACIEKLKDNFCFPYCVGLHQRRSGSLPITLYSERTLSAGVYMTNTDCSAPQQEALPDEETSTFSTETMSSTRGELSNMTTITGIANGLQNCRASPTHNSLFRRLAGCPDGEEGTCLGQDLEALGTTFSADPGRESDVVFADLQPVIVAGDALLIPKCHPKPGGCDWTTSVMRLTSDVQGQYSIQPKITRVPSMRISPHTINLKHVLVLPRETMDYRKWYNPAAQTETGVFYSINPDTTNFQCYILKTCTQIVARGEQMSSRVLFTEPSYQCTKNTNVTMPAGVQARMCSANLTREVIFAGKDSFWFYGQTPTEIKQLQQNTDENKVRNLFVEDIQYFNTLNVVVAVRRGPVSHLLYENGQLPYPDDVTRLSSTVFYFVNTNTLQVRANAVWSAPAGSTAETTYGLLCPSDSILPPFASMAASFVAVLIKAAEIILNQFVLNIIGVVEAAVSRRAETGSLCMHGTQDHYAFFPCSPGPLSMRPVYRIFLRFHAKVLKCTKASLVYVSYLIDMPLSEYHWSQGAAYAFTPPNLDYTIATLRAFRFSLASGVGIVGNAAVTTFYGVMFLYEHIGLPYFIELMSLRYSGNTRQDIIMVVYTLSNTIHQAVTSDAMDNTLLLPAEQSCISLAMLTGDSARPLGQFVEHSCLAVFEGLKTVTRLVPSMFTLTAVTNCICAQSSPVLQWASVSDVYEVCQIMMPPALRAHYWKLLAAHSAPYGVNYRTALCAELIDNIEANANKIPVDMFAHMDLAANAIAGIPQQFVSVLNIPGLNTWACGSYKTDIGVVTIVPQPIRLFKKCAYTRTCRAACSESIDWFRAEAESTPNRTKPATTGHVSLGIPMWQSPDTLFAPLLAQDYGTRHGCRHWVAVLGETFNGNTIGHKMSFLCQSMQDTAVIDERTEAMQVLPELLEQGFHFGTIDIPTAGGNQKTKAVNEMWFAPLLDNKFHAVLLISASIGDIDNGLYEVRVYADARSPLTRWVATASATVNVYTLCPGIIQAAAAQHHSLQAENLRLQMTSVSRPVLFQKFVLAPHKGVGYRMYGQLVGHASDTSTGGDIRFVVVIELSVNLAMDDDTNNVACKAGHHSLHSNEPDNLAQFLQYSIFKRTMFVDTLDHMISIGQQLRNDGTRYTVEYHDVVEEYNDKHKSNTFRLRSLKVFPCTMQSQTIYRLSRNRRRLYAQGDTFRPDGHGGAILAVQTDQSATSTALFSLLETDSTRLPNTGTWLEQHTVNVGNVINAITMRTDPLGSETSGIVLSASRHTSIQEVFGALVARSCDYMDCSGCSTLGLQRSCYQAQRCAIVNCVGTTVNTNNVLCVVGALAQELLATDAMYETWALSVELVMGVVRKWTLGKQASVVNVQGVSSMIVARMCGLKDLVATVSAVLPALFYTIYAGVLGGDASGTAPGRSAFIVVQRAISPLQKLEATELVTGITALIYQFLILPVLISYNSVRILMCFVDQVASFASGHINLVINDVGEAQDERFCLGTDTDYGATGETDADMLQRVVREGSLSGVATQTTYTSSNSLDGEKFVTTAGNMILWKKKMPQIMMIASLTTVLDWVIGLMYGMARVSMAAQDPDCNPKPAHVQTVIDCACGDLAHDISDVQRNSNVDTGALWCSGVMRLVNAHGDLVYVHNKLSFHQLSNRLGGSSGVMHLYLQCIAQENEDNCVAYKNTIDMIEKDSFSDHSVSAINVLTRCRENYAAKTWDSGLFAVFNQEIRASVIASKQINEDALDFIKKNVIVYLCGTGLHCAEHGAVAECLRLGPEFNSIEHCMSLHFRLQTTRVTLLKSNIAGRYDLENTELSGRSRTRQDMAALNRMEYFMYTQRTDTSDVRNADACLFASSEDLQTNKNVQECSPHAQQCVHGRLSNPTTCALNMVQGTASRSSTANPVSLFMVLETNTKRSETKIMHRYETVQQCALDFFTDFVNKLKVEQILEQTSYDLLSYEGDLVHRHIDCVILGPRSELDMLPSLDTDTVEQLTYSRAAAVRFLETGTACPMHILMDSHHTTSSAGQDVIIDNSSTICGSGPRIAALSYISRVIHSESAAKKAMSNLINQRINQVQASIKQISSYGCPHVSDKNIPTSWENCCGLNHDKTCSSPVGNFYPTQLDLRMTIPTSSILSEINRQQGAISLQERAMTKTRCTPSPVFLHHHVFPISLSLLLAACPQTRTNATCIAFSRMLLGL